MDNRKLTDHFTLYDLTATNHEDLQYTNRLLSDDQTAKLQRVAELVEMVWSILEVPVMISSGYRCAALNQAVGSSLRSQHLLCEAADIVPRGMEVLDAFKKLRQAAKEHKFHFGQLLFEQANRGYGEGVSWIHISLGFPYRNIQRCGQILTMNEGTYTLIDTIPQEEAA